MQQGEANVVRDPQQSVLDSVPLDRLAGIMLDKIVTRGGVGRDADFCPAVLKARNTQLLTRSNRYVCVAGNWQ